MSGKIKKLLKLKSLVKVAVWTPTHNTETSAAKCAAQCSKVVNMVVVSL